MGGVSMTRGELLRQVGPVLYGEEWRAALARALGEFYPTGPRDRIDGRLVRRWGSSRDEVPDWAIAGVRVLLMRQFEATARLHRETSEAIDLIAQQRRQEAK